MNSEIEGFLLYVRPKGLQCLVAIVPDGHLTAKTFSMPEQASEAAAWSQAENGRGKNVYWTVNPVSRFINTKPSKADIAQIEWAHLDIDPDISKGYKVGRDQILGQVLLGFQNHELKPSMILDTGNGIAVYYRLSPVISIERGEQVNRRLIGAFNGDRSTYNADRLMRLPGTLNFATKTKLAKGYPSNPTAAKAIAYPNVTYAPDQLENAFGGYALDVEVARIGEAFAEDTRPLTDQEVSDVWARLGTDLNQNPALCQRWSGNTSGLQDTSGSGMDMSLMSLLKAHGYQYREAAVVLWGFSDGSKSNREPRKWDRYLQRLWTRSSVKTPADIIMQNPLAIFPAAISANIASISELRVTTAADVEPRMLDWLWLGVLPRGKVSTIAGDPGVGKGVFTTFIAATVSTGTDWRPGECCAQGTVAFLAHEDGKEDTVVPRLIAAGADLSRVKFIDGVVVLSTEGTTPFDLDASSKLLDQWLANNPDVTVLIIDPINDFLGSKTDSYKDAEVRHVLNPLKIMAEKHNVAVILVSHMNKGNGKASYRIMGAMAFTGVARIVLVITKDESDPELRLILPVKANITKDTVAHSYRIREKMVLLKNSKGETVPVGQPVVELNAETQNLTADQVLNASLKGPNLDGEIKDFLQQELANGPVPAKEMAIRCKDAGMSHSTINRRKKEFGVISERQNVLDPKSIWIWRLMGAPAAPQSIYPPVQSVQSVQSVPQDISG